MSTPVEFGPLDPHASPNKTSHQNTSRYEFRMALKDAKGPINALTLSKDATLLLSGGMIILMSRQQYLIEAARRRWQSAGLQHNYIRLRTSPSK